ncbi:hypothetical protein BDR06DRAFT_977133 [Suillus hirtellus]|nr:hypothetical protein BDR06DRAFT_977133 [Suillus hirtellus]
MDDRAKTYEEARANARIALMVAPTIMLLILKYLANNLFRHLMRAIGHMVYLMCVRPVTRSRGDIQHDSYLIPHNIEHREGPSNSAPQSVLPLVPNAQPVTPVVPPPTPTVLSPVPDTLQSVSSTFIPVIFRVSKLPKCTIFINCFFADADTIQKMAQSSMNAEISNDVELVAWSKTKDGRLEVDKLCKALGTIKKNIQFLSRSAVLWGYDLHNALMMKHAKEVEGMQVTVAFANTTIRYFVRQLLFHDRKYINYIGEDQNIKHLFIYVGVLFKWVFSELSGGIFKDRDFTMDDKMKEFKTELTALFNAIPAKDRGALLKNIFTQGGEAI